MTTGVRDTAIVVGGRRLTPQVLPEWQLLLTHLEISEGFSFVVLVVPDADWASACRLALSHSLDAQGKSLLTIDFDGAEDFKTQLPGRLLNINVSNRTGAIWLEKTVSETSPYFAEWQDAWRGFVARLNQLRNPLRRYFKVPVIFVAAGWIQPLIRETAPDLWSVRTLVTRIHPAEESTSRNLHTEGTTREHDQRLAIDPELALRTAERLRGKPGMELALADVLYRAGLGLLARSEWKQGENALRESVSLQRRFEAPPESVATTTFWLSYCLEWQGQLAKALGLMEEACQLFAHIGDVLGEANCIHRFGEIALIRFDYVLAQTRFEEALPLYRRIGDVLGEANCIKSLGDLSLRQSDLTTAETRFEEALPLYRRANSRMGMANCIKRLGEVAFRRSDYDTAQSRFEEALPLYRRISDLAGEANCIKQLGDIALYRSDLVTAKARLEEALPLYRRVGQTIGEANCTFSLGDVAFAEGLMTDAHKKYEDALCLYESVDESVSIGWCHLKLARLGPSTERDEHLKAAREAWSIVGRSDLIEYLDKEFKVTENT